MINEKLKSRLVNWKFEDALKYLDGSETPVEKLHIKSLAKSYGNSGWFGGEEGKKVSEILRVMFGIKG